MTRSIVIAGLLAMLAGAAEAAVVLQPGDTANVPADFFEYALPIITNEEGFTTASYMLNLHGPWSLATFTGERPESALFGISLNGPGVRFSANGPDWAAACDLCTFLGSYTFEIEFVAGPNERAEFLLRTFAASTATPIPAGAALLLPPLAGLTWLRRRARA